MKKNESNNMQRNILTYSLILGLTLVFYSVLLHALELGENKLMSGLSYLFMLGILVFGIKSQRDKYQDGFISFGEGVKFGLLVSLLGSVLISIFTVFMIKVVDPGIENRTVELALEEALKQGQSEAVLGQIESMTHFFMKPWMLIISTIFGFTVIGVIESLIISAIFQKKKDAFADAMQNV